MIWIKKTNDYIFKIIFIFKEIYKSGFWTLFFSLFSMMISGLIPILISWAVSEIVKILGNNSNYSTLLNKGYLIFLFLMLIFSVMVDFFTKNVKDIICNITGLKLTHNIETLVANKFQYIPQKNIDNPEFLDLYENTLNKSSYEPMNIFDSLFSIISLLFGVIGYAMILSHFNPIFLLLTIIPILPMLKFKLKIGKDYHIFLRKNTMQTRQTWYYFSLITEPKNSNEIRGFDLFKYFGNKRKKLFDDFIKGHYKYATKEVIYSIVFGLVAISGIGVSEFWLLNSALKGYTSISDFVLLSPSIIFLGISLLSLVTLFSSHNKSILFLDYLFEFLKTPTSENKDTTEKNDLTSNNKVNSIHFCDVSFKYPGNDNYALKNINIEFNIGEKVCFVGENGSGKTTFIKLLLGIYEPLYGKILLNGKNIKEYDVLSYRKLFGITFQNYINYALDVKSCIGVGNICNIDDLEKIKSVAKKTRSDDFIKMYKNQYDTNLSKMFYDNAIEPSGGQWQKLAISRTLFSEASILILDEPTAALDACAEDEIFKIFDENSDDKILIIISHRMCSAKLADKIVLFDKGEIIMAGNHAEMMFSSNKYRQMFNLQADKYK
ncbi:MAG: ABC transporter ATP-binding protein/permease [Lactobacillales bacterium]|jgi:ATP-binding cassette subfamily B protein|nr:ABC transporter ATP-binding protein/permease [Lactobacillales bacterium]